MVRTRRSEARGGGGEERPYCPDQRQQDDSVDGWAPRALRSHYRVTRKRQHWPTQLVSRRLRAIKMPRIMYPESEDTEAEKFNRRKRRSVRVFFKGEQSRQLRPLQPNNYMEESDKPMQETECHVRRSGRQRKLLHHTFNESWITNELKVKGYPRLLGLRQMCSTSEMSSEDERPRSKRIVRPHVRNKPLNGRIASDDEQQSDKPVEKKTCNQSKGKKEAKTDEEKDNKKMCENGSAAVDSDKSEIKKELEKEDQKTLSEGGNEEKTIVMNHRLRRRRPPITKQSNRNEKKEDDNSHSQRETASESENSSDSEIVVRRNLRRSNRTRKPRNSFIESASCEGKNYGMRKKPYNTRKTYSLRERKQPKIIVRSQSPTTSSNSSSSSDSDEELNVSVKNKTKTRQKPKTLGEHCDRALRDIQPIKLDGSIRFSSVGGLEDHIRCLREMVLFPLMYPQLFDKFGFRPPKGVLFHGPPGTGKTLLARALANECSIQSGQQVSFFMRKGADCLKKWVGESERNIKLLFQQANKMKPSIIFFDEIDALAPVRSARQDQVHTSVVGTLLAEMDGLCDRGEVIVIGATNRLDGVDPALRRAGRFDRELHFPPPPANQRAAILRVLTSSWNPLASEDTIQYIADITTGYGGSDLKALCSESVLKALERTYPQVYRTHHALLIDPIKVEILREDMVAAMKGLVAAGSRCAPPPTRPILPYLVPLLSSNVDMATSLAKKIFPPADKHHYLEMGSGNDSYARHWSSVLLIRGSCSSSHIGPAVLTNLEHCAIRELSMSTLHQGALITAEQAILSVFAEIRRCSQGKNGCIIYTPSVDLLWPLLGETGSSLITHLWQEIAAMNNCLFLATSDCTYEDLPEDVQMLFPHYKDCVYDIKEATQSEISNMLKPLFLVKPFEYPTHYREIELPELPKAPPPPAPRPSALELHKKARRENHVLRELRIFLRDVCRKLAANRRFYKFTKPVDLEEVTDYPTIIKTPMDLETMMTKVDMHRYNCARDFLKDIDLICANALEYNPDRTSSDKQIRHEACSLRDHAYALVEVEMDTDFEEECRVIAAQKATMDATAQDKDLPNFIYTANHAVNGLNPTPTEPSQDQPNETLDVDASNSLHTSSSKRKRKKKSLWSKGMVAKKARTSLLQKDNNPAITDEESKENKPICSSPVNGEPSITDNDTGPSEHDHVSPRNVNKANHSPSDVNSNSQGTINDNSTHEDSNSGPVRKLHIDKEEMLFDANAVDGVNEGNRLLDCPSPVEARGQQANNLFTSTPHRKKLSSLEHSNKNCDNKLIVNREDLDSAFNKCAKSLKGVELKPLIDLYYQLDRVVNKYSVSYNRTDLPAELKATVDRFVKAISK